MRGMALAWVCVMLAAGTASAQSLERDSPDCSAEAQDRARAGAEKNEPAALYLMARYYSTGKCVTGDGAKALDYYKKAADLNYPPAFYNLGVVAAANQNYEGAETDFLKGASLGHRGAELQIGILYSIAPPPVGNKAKGLAWLTLTAKRGEVASSEASDILTRLDQRFDDASRKQAEAIYKDIKAQYGPVPEWRP